MIAAGVCDDECEALDMVPLEMLTEFSGLAEDFMDEGTGYGGQEQTGRAT